MHTERSSILIVDDEPDIVAVLKDFLLSKGFRVICAFSGEEALNMLEREKADLILLDIKMPGIKGTEAAKIIKNKYPLTKIIVLTGYPGEINEGLAKDKIFDGIFTKPIRMHELLSRLLSILNQGKYPNSDFNLQQQGEANRSLLVVRLLIVESSLEIYNFLEEHFKQLSRKGEHYLLSVASNKEQINEKLSLFNPDILLANASFFRDHGEDIISDILAKNLYSKEVLVYNIDNVKNCSDEKLNNLTKNIEITCIKRGITDFK